MIVVICFFYLFSVMVTADTADTAAKVTWSKVNKGSYNNLSPYTLDWPGNVLGQGGYSLSDMDTTTSSNDANFVITNQVI